MDVESTHGEHHFVEGTTLHRIDIGRSVVLGKLLGKKIMQKRCIYVVHKKKRCICAHVYFIFLAIGAWLVVMYKIQIYGYIATGFVYVNIFCLHF